MFNLKIKRRNFITLASILGADLVIGCASDSSDKEENTPSTEGSTEPTITAPPGGWYPYGPDVPYDTGKATSTDEGEVDVGGGNKAEPIDIGDKYNYYKDPISGIELYYLFGNSEEKSLCIATDPSQNYLPVLEFVLGKNNHIMMTPRSSSDIKTFGDIMVHKNGNISHSKMNEMFQDQKFIYRGYHSLEDLCTYKTPLNSKNLVVNFEGDLFNLMSNSKMSSSPSDLADALSLDAWPNVYPSTKLHLFSANLFFNEDFPFIYLSPALPTAKPFTSSGYHVSELYPIQNGNQWIHSRQTTTVAGTEKLLGDDFACLKSGLYQVFYGFNSTGELTCLVGQKDPYNGKYVFTNPIRFTGQTESDILFLDYPDVKGVKIKTTFECNEKKDLVINKVPYGDCFLLKQSDIISQNDSELGTTYAEYYLHRSTGPVQVYREADGTPKGTVYLESVSRITTADDQIQYLTKELFSKRKDNSLLVMNNLAGLNFKR